uniref:Uncharacterized protein n=1 Tax=viral metagenome TaxID=1070528 RepID=A0A6M3IME0_9ZZZZ
MKTKKLRAKVQKQIDSNDNFTSVAILSAEMVALIEVIAPLIHEQEKKVEDVK